MRIAYIYYMVRKEQVGVEKKIAGQAKAIASAGLDELEIYVLNPSRHDQVGNINYLKFPAALRPANYFDYVFRRYNLITRTLDLQKFDYVILRYPLADKTGVDFAERFKVITEHNTMEPSELISSLPFTNSPIERMAKRLLLWQENRYAARTLQNCKGVIALTNEIRAFELARAQATSLPAITVANGIDVESIPLGGFKCFDGKRLDVVFVATFLRPWHGLDRVIKSFNRYRGGVRWTLHVIGNIHREQLQDSSSDLRNVSFHGVKTGKELNDILGGMHLAISTVALFRNNMLEACTLKTREYTARGLPFILAYDDPDLRAVDDSLKFYLSLENNESPLNVEKILDFAQDVSNRQEAISAYMRAYARQHMDWHVKLKQYVDFVHQINQGSLKQ